MYIMWKKELKKVFYGKVLNWIDKIYRISKAGNGFYLFWFYLYLFFCGAGVIFVHMYTRVGNNSFQNSVKVNSYLPVYIDFLFYRQMTLNFHYSSEFHSSCWPNLIVNESCQVSFTKNRVWCFHSKHVRYPYFSIIFLFLFIFKLLFSTKNLICEIVLHANRSSYHY